MNKLRTGYSFTTAANAGIFHVITDEAIYTKANSFVPERWYQFPDMIKDKDAFAPFSAGKMRI